MTKEELIAMAAAVIAEDAGVNIDTIRILSFIEVSDASEGKS